MNLIIVARAVVRTEKEGKLLLIKRSPRERYSPDLWECPGGKSEKLQSIARTAQVEVFEETGISTPPMSNVFLAENRHVTEGIYAGRRFLVYFGIADIPEIEEVVLSNEHVDSRWVTYAEALTMELVRETRIGLIALQKYLT